MGCERSIYFVEVDSAIGFAQVGGFDDRILSHATMSLGVNPQHIIP